MTVDPRYAAAMRQLESSGNYSALGPVVTKGRYAGDRAYGAYQVMGKNIPEWTKTALGRSLTPQEYLASREAQDRVFNYFFGQSLAKYGNPQDAASVWHSGRPLSAAKKAGANDGYMATADYVAKFTQFADGGVSARAQAGWASGVPAEAGGVDIAGVQAAMMPGTTSKRDAFMKAVEEVSGLRQQADVTSQTARTAPLQLAPPKVRGVSVLQSPLVNQPIQITPTYVN